MKVLDISKDHLRIVLAVAASAFVGFGLRLFRSPTRKLTFARLHGLVWACMQFISTACCTSTAPTNVDALPAHTTSTCTCTRTCT